MRVHVISVAVASDRIQRFYENRALSPGRCPELEHMAVKPLRETEEEEEDIWFV